VDWKVVGVGPKIGRKAKDKLEEKTESGGQSFKSDKKSKKKISFGFKYIILTLCQFKKAIISIIIICLPS
jgi:hypothetical protein